MGQAKQRREAANRLKDTLAKIDREQFAVAVRQIVNAITNVEGADCLHYAMVGAGLLRELGVPAQAVAGTAAWRVGPGDGDVVSHDTSADTAVMALAQRAAMFHAWIEYDGAEGRIVVDLTTKHLRSKARSLDEMDGGNTRVDFCPDMIWGPAPPARSAQWVAQQAEAGIYTYVRNPKIEQMVLGDNRAEIEADSQQSIMVALLAYRALKAGHVMKVVGVGADGEFQETAPTLDSVTKIRIR